MPLSRRGRHEVARWPTEREAAVLDRTGANVVGVAGSSGKTITASLLSELLRGTGGRVWLGLQPALARPDRLSSRDHVLLELPCRPPTHDPGRLDVLVMTGLAADELPEGVELRDAVAAMAEAVSATRRVVVANADDARVLALTHNGRVPVRTASLNGHASHAHVLDGYLALAVGAGQLRLLPLLATFHSRPALAMDMVLAAGAAAALGVEPDHMRCVLTAHQPPPGRLELLGTTRGIRWVDDSCGTRPGRAAAALDGQASPVVLLAGGRKSGHNLARWSGTVARSCAHALLFGDASGDMAKALRAVGYVDRIVRCSDLTDAVSIVPRLAVRGDTVLYSPGAEPDPECPAFRHLVPMSVARREAA